MSKIGDIFGVPVHVDPRASDDTIIILGPEVESDSFVPSEIPGHHLKMKRRQFQIINVAKGVTWGDELDYATEVLVTEKGMKMITKSIKKSEADNA